MAEKWGFQWGESCKLDTHMRDKYSGNTELCMCVYVHSVIPVELVECSSVWVIAVAVFWGEIKLYCSQIEHIVFCVQCAWRVTCMRFFVFTFQILRLGSSHPFCDWPEVRLKEKHSRATFFACSAPENSGFTLSEPMIAFGGACVISVWKHGRRSRHNRRQRAHAEVPQKRIKL